MVENADADVDIAPLGQPAASSPRRKPIASATWVAAIASAPASNVELEAGIAWNVLHLAREVTESPCENSRANDPAGCRPTKGCDDTGGGACNSPDNEACSDIPTCGIRAVGTADGTQDASGRGTCKYDGNDLASGIRKADRIVVHERIDVVPQPARSDPRR